MSMTYKGYVGVVEFDADDRILHGRVAGLRDLITFQGASVEEIEREFRTSVDVYLEFCEEQGREPEQPFSGKFVLRTSPDVHRAAVQAAAREGKSLNAWAADALAAAAGVPGAVRPAIAPDPSAARTR